MFSANGSVSFAYLGFGACGRYLQFPFYEFLDFGFAEVWAILICGALCKCGRNTSVAMKVKVVESLRDNGFVAG
jgi:hypothetical protein